MTAATVVVVNWNGAHLLPGCLDALRKQDTDDFETVVVDNASTDGSVALLRRDYPWVRVLETGKNLGFAGGNNAALRDLATPFAVLLNNDAVPEPTWLSATLAAFDDPKVGVVTPKILFLQRSGAFDVVNNAGGIVLTNGDGADRGFQEVDRGQYDERTEVFAFCGNGAAFRREVLEQVGLFDEDFFLYYEDTDLSWRVRAAGWRIRYEPAAVLRHHHAASSGEWSPLFTFHVHRNRLLMLTKNASARFALRHVLRYPLTTASMALRALRAGVAERRRPAVRPTLLRLRVMASYLRLLPAMLARRRAIDATRVVSRADLERWLVTHR